MLSASLCNNLHMYKQTYIGTFTVVSYTQNGLHVSYFSLFLLHINENHSMSLQLIQFLKEVNYISWCEYEILDYYPCFTYSQKVFK